MLALGACATTTASSNPEVPSVPAPTQSPEHTFRTSKVWQILPTDALQHYTVSINTHIQELGSPEIRTDSTTSKAQYTLGLTRTSDSTFIKGSIEQFSTQAGTIIGYDSSSSVYPILFDGYSKNHEISFDVPSNTSSPCSSTSQAALSIIPRSIFLLPLQIRIGTTWRDSTSFMTCNGLLMIKIVDIKSYTVIGETEFSGNPALTIEQTERALSSGEGSQDQHLISIRGDTRGTGQLTIDTVTGLLLKLVANRRGTVSIQTSGRNHQFLQTSVETITRIN